MNDEFATRPAVRLNLIPSLASLRGLHRELLKRHREVGNTPEVLAGVDDFIERGSASGALLDRDADRQAAQSLLDYWSTRMYRLGREVPEAILAEFNPALAPELADALNPYMGLEAFQETNREVFFGRQKLVESLVSHLKDNRLLVVVGPSGSGKSSVVRAGLVSALKRGALPGSEAWQYLPPFVPGSRPLDTLARVSQAGVGQPPERLEAQAAAFLNNPRSLLQSLTRPTVLVVDQFEEVFTLCGSDRVRTAFVDNLVALTQAPPAATAAQPAPAAQAGPVAPAATAAQPAPAAQARPAAQTGLAAQAGPATQAGPAAQADHIVILTMRADFEGQVARLPDFLPLFERALVRVTPLNAAEIREAIEGPASLVGLKFEEGIVEALLNDVLGEPAALPLLQYTLLKLWEGRERNRVTWAAYRRLGGGRQALASGADAFYRQLIPEEQVTARRLLLRLVRPGEGLEVTSNRMRRASLYVKAEARDRIDRVLDKFIQAHLLHLTRGETAADDQIEVAHEALVRNWPTLIAWLEEERQRIRERHRLTAAAEQWQLLGRDPSALWRGVLLDDAAHYSDLNELETEFIAASRAVLEAAARAERAAHERELEAARKLAAAETRRAEEQARSAARLRRVNRLITGAVAIALLTAALACLSALFAVFFGFQARGNAAQAQAASTQAMKNANIAQAASTQAVSQAQLALARQLAAQSVSASNFQPGLALLLSLEAIRTADTPETRSSLFNALGSNSQLKARLSDHTATVDSVAFSRDGKLLASASDDQNVILWDSSGDHFFSRNPTDCGCSVKSVAFSPDGQTVAAGTHMQVILLRDLGNSTPTKTSLQGYPDWIESVAFSPDGKTLAAGGRTNSIYIWDVATGKLIGQPLTGHTGVVWSVAFSPDGAQLASGSDDHTIRLWDVATGKQAGPILGLHTAAVRSVAYSPDGKFLASGSDDATIRFWDPATGVPLGDPLTNHTGAVLSVAFSPDGKSLASGSEDTTILLWDVGTHATLGLPLNGHTAAVTSVAFSPDGKRLASGGADKQVILWDVLNHSQLRQVLPQPSRSVLAIAVPPDVKDQTLAVGTNQNIILWNLAASPPVSQTLSGHNSLVYRLAFSPDGAWLASSSCAKFDKNGCAEAEVFLWDRTANPPAIKYKLAGHTNWVSGLAFSPDSKRLVTASWDMTLNLWDVGTGNRLGQPLTGYKTKIDSLALSPDGNTLAVGYLDPQSDAQAGNIDLWNLAAAQPTRIQTLPKAHTRQVFSLAFSPDGKLLASGGGDRTIVIWDVRDLSNIKALQTLAGHFRAVNSVAFSPDSKYLASGSDDKTVILWDVTGGNIVGRPLGGYTDLVSSVVFSSNGQTLATASLDGVISLWNLSFAAWQTQACQQAGRNLSQAEWAQYFGGAPYHKSCEQWPEGK